MKPLPVKRGSLVTVAAKGHYSGKPRPAVILQSDLFAETSSVTIALLSSEPVDAPLLRLTVEPSAANGLQKTSQIMIDKLVTVQRDALGAAFGTLEAAKMLEADRLLALFLGIAGPPAAKRSARAKTAARKAKN